MSAVRRQPSRRRTSFPLEEVELKREDGTLSRLALKRLDRGGLSTEALRAKPKFVHDPAREPAVYATVLPQAPPGPPRYHGAVVDPDGGRHLLLLEWVEGHELREVGERALWEEAARWLGRFHLALSASAEAHARSAHLLEHDAALLCCWIARARRFARAPETPASRRRALEWLGRRYEAVVEGLLAMPATVIHGEFYASNVIIGSEGTTPRVAPIDWELAAHGPGALDLAALVSGKGWAAADREAIAAAYRSTAGPDACSQRELELARLHVAVQWLGWAPPSWSPPPDQCHDWLGEAVALAEGLGL